MPDKIDKKWQIKSRQGKRSANKKEVQFGETTTHDQMTTQLNTAMLSEVMGSIRRTRAFARQQKWKGEASYQKLKTQTKLQHKHKSTPRSGLSGHGPPQSIGNTKGEAAGEESELRID